MGTFFVLLAETENASEYTRVPNKVFLEKAVQRKGRGTFRDDLRILFAYVDASVEDAVDELQEALEEHVKQPHVSVQAESDKWHVQIEYLTNAEGKHADEEAIFNAAVHELDSYLHKPKE